MTKEETIRKYEDASKELEKRSNRAFIGELVCAAVSGIFVGLLSYCAERCGYLNGLKYLNDSFMEDVKKAEWHDLDEVDV